MGNIKNTDPAFTDDAVIFAESLEVLVMVLHEHELALHEVAKPLGFQVSSRTEAYMFEGMLGETIQFMHVCCEDINTLQGFMYLGSVVHNNGG